MISNPYSWLHKAGILGMNERNADYIMRANPREAFPLVDDKVETKNLAKTHHIPTPALYHVIRFHGDIRRSRKVFEEHREFVAKPARGSGGSGILLITDRTEEGFIKQNGEILSERDLYYHLSSILSGIYSLEGLEDKVLIEALIHVDPVFEKVTYQGVPDIRIVVYRGIPVMGMVRLPTRSSDGKANLHRGAIGAGIAMSSGRTLDAVHGQSIVTHHPDTGHPVGDREVPHWKPILLMTARSFEMTGLGYLGVDIVIDREKGPLLLEMNVRPGLAIQLANRAGLRERLERIDQAPGNIFSTPESRVAWAIATFSGSG
jgi:alpha-L-glutamate ligase-like protein